MQQRRLKLKTKIKYDILIQALGQAIGNLQQYSILSDFGKCTSINIENFPILNDFVPQAKDYRSCRTHSDSYPPGLFRNLLSTIDISENALMMELTALNSILIKENNLDEDVSTCNIY